MNFADIVIFSYCDTRLRIYQITQFVLFVIRENNNK